MSLRVEHPLVKGEHRVVGIEEEEVLERLGEEEALLDIVLRRIQLVDVADPAVAGRRPTPLLQSLRQATGDMTVLL